MFTQFWFAGQKSNAISEATFVVERDVGAHLPVRRRSAFCGDSST